MSIFTGSGVALITPFKKDGSIDYDSFEKLIDFQIENRTDALIICGTTGEGSTVTFEEKAEIFSFAVKKVKNRVPVVAGTGSNSTSHSLKQIHEAEKAGVDAHLIVTPYYNKTSQSGLVQHYYTLANDAKKPIIVYNVPSRTGVDISLETYRKLAQHKNIVGVKEASGDLTKCMKIISDLKGEFDLYIGNDDQTASAVAMGAKGVISVLANIFPYETHLMAKSGIDGDTAFSHSVQAKFLPLISALFDDVNPIPVKYAAEYIGLCGGTLRLPLVEATDTVKTKLRTEIDRIRN